MFSKACEYGIKAVLYIASRSLQGDRVKMEDIVAHVESPEAFTGKILGNLSKNNILDSYKGPNGGFEISPSKMKSITIADIVSVIDGNTLFYGCALGLKECDEEHPCPMHKSFAVIRDQLKEALSSTNVYELATELSEGKYFIIR